MAHLNEWNFFNRNVQSGMTEGQFMAAQFTMVAAGPPNLDFLAGQESDVEYGQADDLVFPIGITQRFGISQQRQHARVWEIGSERSYWISGRSVGQIALGRIIYHGPNLLRVLYAYYRTDNYSEESNVDFNHLMGNSATIADANNNRNPHKMVISPGYKNIFLNLASDLFMQPIGLMLYFKDSNNESVYAAYAENCVIPNHDLGMDAGGTVMQENVSIQFERLLPIWIADAISVTDIESANRISRPQNETGGYKFAHTSHNS